MEYSIIVTAFNEERTIPGLLRELEACREGPASQTEIILVDDGSTDKTLQTANRLKKKYRNLRIIRNNTNRGRGFALKKGVEAARGGVIGIIDADMQYSPNDLKRMLRLVKKGSADLVCGRRIKNRNGIVRRLLSLGFNLTCRMAFSVPVHDANAGIKAGKKELFQTLPLCGGAYRLVAARAAKKCRIAETAVRHKKRTNGQSRIPTPRIFIETLAELLKAAGER